MRRSCLAWLSWILALIQIAAAKNYFISPPDNPEGKQNYGDNPVYRVGQQIDIQWHVDPSIQWSGTANLWIEGPAANEDEANDINNYIDQVDFYQVVPDAPGTVSGSEDDVVTKFIELPPPPGTPTTTSIVTPNQPRGQKPGTTVVISGQPESTETVASGPFKLSKDGSASYTWTVKLAKNPVAKGLIEKHGSVVARFRLDDIMHPDSIKIARSRYFNITNLDVAPTTTKGPPSPTLTSLATPKLHPNSTSSSAPADYTGKGYCSDTRGTFTQGVTIGLAVGGTFAGLLAFGTVAFCLWRRFRKAALIRLDDETTDFDPVDVSELQWNEKAGIGQAEGPTGFEVTIVQRLETIHEVSDESSVNS